MLTSQQIEKLKAIPITKYLASIGHYPDKKAGAELQYFSPIRNESTASFFVNPDKNVFQDFGGEKGDIIRLVSIINKSGFVQSCKILQAWTPCEMEPVSRVSSDANCPQTQTQDDSQNAGKIRLIKAVELTNSALIRYAENRGIPFLLAAKYCKEVHYENKGRKYYALGFESDKGGFELRNSVGDKEFKACISPKGITTILVPGSTAISVFEGFFDFLSALVYYRVSESKNSVVILNSTSNLKSAFPVLSGYSKIFSYLDNDATGLKTFRELKKLEKNCDESVSKTEFPHTNNGACSVINRSNVYQDYKDFSEMLLSMNLRKSNP